MRGSRPANVGLGSEVHVRDPFKRGSFSSGGRVGHATSAAGFKIREYSMPGRLAQFG